MSEVPLYTASVRRGNTLKCVEDLYLEAKALTVSCAPYSLDSGPHSTRGREGQVDLGYILCQVPICSRVWRGCYPSRCRLQAVRFRWRTRDREGVSPVAASGAVLALPRHLTHQDSRTLMCRCVRPGGAR